MTFWIGRDPRRQFAMRQSIPGNTEHYDSAPLASAETRRCRAGSYKVFVLMRM
jgi:hypothetical protein